jgi:DNA-binding PadR family transcriptional regulator
MYEFLVLAQLSRCPMHGYRIAGIIGDIIGPFRRVQWGALYPVLSRLERDGLIRATAEDGECHGRPRKVYAITPLGSERLHEMVMDTEHHLGEYEMLFAHKVSLFSQLTFEERRFLARHYAVYAQQNLDHLQRERRDLLQNSGLDAAQIGDIVAVMDHRIAHWRAEGVWAEELIRSTHQKETA